MHRRASGCCRPLWRAAPRCCRSCWCVAASLHHVFLASSPPTETLPESILEVGMQRSALRIAAAIAGETARHAGALLPLFFSLILPLLANTSRRGKSGRQAWTKRLLRAPKLHVSAWTAAGATQVCPGKHQSEDSANRDSKLCFVFFSAAIVLQQLPGLLLHRRSSVRCCLGC